MTAVSKSEADEADFCRMNDMRPPKITQNVRQSADPTEETTAEEGLVATVFQGKITLDDEEYIDE